MSAAVLEKADAPPAVLMFDALNGKEVTRIPTAASFRQRFKHPYIIIHRVRRRLVRPLRVIEWVRASHILQELARRMPLGFLHTSYQRRLICAGCLEFEF